MLLERVRFTCAQGHRSQHGNCRVRAENCAKARRRLAPINPRMPHYSHALAKFLLAFPGTLALVLK
jgi:hypothetical protein